VPGDLLHHALESALDEVRRRRRGDRVQTTFQMLWADELLETQGPMQQDLVDAAELFVRGRRRSIMI
jgi:hypothetical protein